MLSAEKLRELTAAPDTVSDAILQFILDSVTETILNYCRIDELPAGLSQTAYRMAADMYRAEGYGVSSEDGKEAHGAVQSVKAGDTTVAYRDGTSGADYGAYIASVMHHYEAQLNRYRKLGWPPCGR